MSYTSFELGNTQMSGWIYNFLSRRGEFMFDFPKPKPPTPPPPINANNKIIVLMSAEYPVGYELIKYVINLGLVTNNVEIYLEKDGEETLNTIASYYNKGYRFFIGTQNSQELTNLVPFFESHTDCCYFNTYSTIFNLNMSSNMIRSVVNDYVLTKYLNSFFVLNVSYLLKLCEDPTMYIPLSLSPTNEPVFKNFVYIYESSNYTDEFLNMLLTTQEPSLNINITSYLIGENEPLPDELVNLLTENPVSDLNNFQNNIKTLFFLNSSNPQNLLNKFTEKSWYDNYFFCCDPFFSDLLTTLYPLTYSFFGAGCFSSIGYKLSQQIDPNQDISPIALAIVNLIIQLGQWYLNNCKKETTMQELLNNLISIHYLNEGNDDNWYWYEKQIYIYHATYNNTTNTNSIFKEPLIVSASASPTVDGGISSISGSWRSVVFGNGIYVAVSNDGKCVISTDGILWTQSICPNRNWQSVTFGKGIFVAVANAGVGLNGSTPTTELVMTSSNGINWTITNAINSSAWTSVIYGMDIFVAVSSTIYPGLCNVMKSSDGILWSPDCVGVHSGVGWNNVTFGSPSRFLISSYAGTTAIMTKRSTSLSWLPINAPNTKGIFWGFPQGSGLYVGIGSGQRLIIISNDGLVWTNIILPTSLNFLWQSIAFGNNIFVAVSSDGKCMTSPNGTTWTLRTCKLEEWRCVTFGTTNNNPLFVAVSTNGKTMSSPDGIIWT